MPAKCFSCPGDGVFRLSAEGFSTRVCSRHLGAEVERWVVWFRDRRRDVTWQIYDMADFMRPRRVATLIVKPVPTPT